MADESTDPLELIMNTRIRGAEGVRAAKKSVEDYGGAEEKAARTAKVATGVYERLAQARKMLDEAYSGKASVSSDRLRDIELDYKRKQATVDRLSRPEATRGSLTAKAVLSSRFGSGNGFMPLVGQGLDALGGEGTAKGVGQFITGLVDGPLGKFGGVVSLAARATYEAVKAMYAVADASAKVTQRFSDLRGGIGGGSRDAANSLLLSRITGVDAAGGAKAFQEKITSDPLAMGVAGGLGIRNIKSPYGSLSFGPNYQQAIERVSAIQDPNQRRRTAMILGIEQEVNRYSKLSGSTRSLLKQDAGTTARVNSPDSERRAAEFISAQERFEQAKENFTTTAGGEFGRNFTPFINGLATTLNILSEGMNVINEKTRAIAPAFIFAKTVAQMFNVPTLPLDLVSLMGSSAGGPGAGGGANASLNANTMAIQQNSQHLERLNGIIGGGERAQGGIPSALRGANLNRAATLGGIQLGSLS